MSGRSVTSSQQAPTRSHWIRTGVLVVVCLAAIWTSFLYFHPDAVSEAAPEVTTATIVAPPKVEPQLTPEQRQKKLVQGTWEDFYQGHRLLTIREDGTATMSIELDGLGASLFAPRLEFDIQWTMENGRVVMETKRGRPENKAGVILKIYGNRAEYVLEGLDEQHLLLRDVESDKKYEWTRPQTPTASKTAEASGRPASN